MTIDTTKPSTSRIYDYVLGGHHNFEIDRAAAQQIVNVFPSYPRWARLNRWFLQMVAEQWAGAGQRHILDLGSGMPTQGHFHTSATTAKVLYTDNDAMTVAYAKEVIGNNPLVAYIEADIRELAPVLAAADRLFGGDRRVAIGFIGVSYFIDDPALEQVARALYDWAAPGSVMALTFVYGESRTEKNRQAEALFKRNGTGLFPRDEAAVRRLVAPWQLGEVKTLASWLAMESVMQEADKEEADAQMYGVLLERGGA